MSPPKRSSDCSKQINADSAKTHYDPLMTFEPVSLQVVLAVGGMGRREPTGTPSIEQYNPSSRQWRILSQMITGSWGAGLVSMETENGEFGEEVYLVGGSNESSRLSSVAKYNVANDQWTSLADMSIARNGVGVVFAVGKFISFY